MFSKFCNFLALVIDENENRGLPNIDPTKTAYLTVLKMYFDENIPPN